jgi:succinyl-diaminopimelate desuccinylase
MEILRELVSINSVYPNENEIGEFVFSFLISLGFNVERVYIPNTNRFNIVANRGENPRLALFGHLDTVEVSRGWETDPFELTENNGKIYGLGTYDMKGGISCILHAASQTTEPLRIIISVDEENVSEGAHVLSSTSCFDGLEGVISAEAGNSHDFTGGLSRITVSRRGRIVLNGNIYGESAHGASGLGVNAIGNALRVYEQLEHMNNELNGYVKPSLFVRKLNAEARSLSVPDVAEIEIDRHYIVGESIENIINDLSSLVSDIQLVPRRTPYMAPYNFSCSSFSNRISDLIESYNGVRPLENHGLSVGDENVIALHCPVVILGCDGANEHSANEYVLKNSLIDVCNAYIHIIRNF